MDLLQNSTTSKLLGFLFECIVQQIEWPWESSPLHFHHGHHDQRLTCSKTSATNNTPKPWFPMSAPGEKRPKKTKKTTLLHGDALGIQGEGLGNLMSRIRGVVLWRFQSSLPYIQENDSGICHDMTTITPKNKTELQVSYVIMQLSYVGFGMSALGDDSWSFKCTI